MRAGQTLHPMEGVEVRKNAKNGFVVFQLHYHADPAKRDPSYIKTIRESMPIRQFKQEYELQWDSFEGLAVYADWDQNIHGVKRRIDPHLGSPLLIGMDFGLTPAAVVGQLQGDTLCVLKEYTATNMGVKRFLASIIPQMKVDFPMWQDMGKDFIAFIDPSGFFRKDTDETTCATVMEEFGFRQIVPGPVQWEERRTSVETWLCRRTKAGPCFQISTSACPTLVQGFQGGYRYPDGVLDKEPNTKLRPIKDKFSHCFKAGVSVATPQGPRPIEELRIGQLVSTPLGPKKITAAMNSRATDFVEVFLSNGTSLECTPDHPIWDGNGFVRADALQCGSAITWRDQTSTLSKISRGFPTTKNLPATIRQIIRSAVTICTGLFGAFIEEAFQKITTFITKMAIKPTIVFPTWNACPLASTHLNIVSLASKPIRLQQDDKLRLLKNMPPSGIVRLRAENGTVSMLVASPRKFPWKRMPAFFALFLTRLKKAPRNVASVQWHAKTEPDIDPASITSPKVASFALKTSLATKKTSPVSVVRIVPHRQESAIVYDITVDEAHCFFANGILVGNCHDALQYLCAKILGTKPRSVVHVPKPTYSFETKAHHESDRPKY